MPPDIQALINHSQAPGCPLAQTLTACQLCRQGRGPACRCAREADEFVARLESTLAPQPWTALDLILATASVLLILLALHLWS